MWLLSGKKTFQTLSHSHDERDDRYCCEISERWKLSLWWFVMLIVANYNLLHIL